MQRTRPFTTQRLYGMGFIVIVLSLILFIHCAYVFLVYGPKLWNPAVVLLLSVYHFFFVGLMASLYQCVMPDPGVVPPNWGFYMGDETKRRRYCKMCNVWKPDRTHHCSICNRCILNMDHHCPWINNCVGFYNRKFFIQLLVYVYLSLLIVALSSFWDFLAHVCTCFGIWPFTGTSGNENAVDVASTVDTWYIVKSIFISLAWVMSVLLLGTLTNFIKFHVNLVLDNYTTIENLEREENAKCKFDIGQ